MELKIFVLVDKTCGFPRRVLTDMSAGKMLRDHISEDIGAAKGQLPFKDAAYYEIGSLDFETLRITPCEPKLIDVLHEYEFVVENQAVKEPVSSSKVDESVEKGEL